ncbi:MAG: hypothetical protein OI715_00795 (plasmid) [Candidatus Methanoperedens sp.]|nr:MAG: hypothetical protein OI715_00795 [Candidatus Methanoperedens sp.]
MNFRELLLKYKENKSRVIINGLGAGETKGTIIAVNDDYIEYELLNVQKEVKSGKEKATKEVKFIPIANIFDLNEGEKEKISETGLGVFEKK